MSPLELRLRLRIDKLLDDRDAARRERDAARERATKYYEKWRRVRAQYELRVARAKRAA